MQEQQTPAISIQEPGETAREQRVSEVIHDVVATVNEGRLGTIPLDEQECLIAYRLWKQSTDAVTGVFHFKRKTGRKRAG